MGPAALEGLEVDEVVGEPLPELLFPLAVDFAEVDFTLLVEVLAELSEAYSCADWNVTQLDVAGILAVYGRVEIGPRDSGGWVYVVTTPAELVYTPGGSWLSLSQTVYSLGA